MTQPADVEIAVEALRRDLWPDRDEYRACARAVVAALASAGRLIPDGTTTRTKWATRLKAHEQFDEELCESFSAGGFTEEERARARAAHWRRRFGDEMVDVVRRDVHTTPWTVAEEPA